MTKLDRSPALPTVALGLDGVIGWKYAAEIARFGSRPVDGEPDHG